MGVFSGTEMDTRVRCYESHPGLKLGKGVLYGGSASHPRVMNADVYISLQRGSTCGLITDPWDERQVIEVPYVIRDMEAPEDVDRFKRMITWICTQLHEGQKVHVGCIGGHGRTGTVFSAVIAEMLKKKSAIQLVRKHYCHKAVESKAQVQFLMQYYGVAKAEPTKAYHPVASTVFRQGERVAGPLPPWSNRPLFPEPLATAQVRRVLPNKKSS